MREVSGEVRRDGRSTRLCLQHTILLPNTMLQRRFPRLHNDTKVFKFSFYDMQYTHHYTRITALSSMTHSLLEGGFFFHFHFCRGAFDPRGRDDELRYR